MNNKPNIIMTALDLERLERLLEKIPDSEFPGKDALEDELERAEVVEPSQVPPTVVTMNSTVRFRNVADEHEFQLTLVYPKDAGTEGTLSILAPVGSALLGLSVGHEIEWPSPQGKTCVRIEEIVYQPERSGELHR